MNATATHAAADSAAPDTLPTYEEVAAQMRAKYKNFTPEQRARHGDEPDESTILARWGRILCKDHTREQRRAGALRMIRRIYGEEAAKKYEPAPEPAALRR